MGAQSHVLAPVSWQPSCVGNVERPSGKNEDHNSSQQVGRAGIGVFP